MTVLRTHSAVSIGHGTAMHLIIIVVIGTVIMTRVTALQASGCENTLQRNLSDIVFRLGVREVSVRLDICFMLLEYFFLSLNVSQFLQSYSDLVLDLWNQRFKLLALQEDFSGQS